MSTDKRDGGPCVVVDGIDLGAIEADAERSNEKEAYCCVLSGDDSRLGVVVSVSSDRCYTYTMELLVRALAGRTELRVRDMERATRLSKTLKGLGYSIRHEDDGWLSCERVLRRDEVSNECQVLMSIVLASEAEMHGPDGENVKEG